MEEHKTYNPQPATAGCISLPVTKAEFFAQLCCTDVAKEKSQDTVDKVKLRLL